MTSAHDFACAAWRNPDGITPAAIEAAIHGYSTELAQINEEQRYEIYKLKRSVEELTKERDASNQIIKDIADYVSPRMAIASTAKLRAMIGLPETPPTGVDGRIAIIQDQDN